MLVKPPECVVITANPPCARGSTRLTTPAAMACTGSLRRARISTLSWRISILVAPSRRAPGTATGVPRTGRSKRAGLRPLPGTGSDVACSTFANSPRARPTNATSRALRSTRTRSSSRASARDSSRPRRKATTARPKDRASSRRVSGFAAKPSSRLRDPRIVEAGLGVRGKTKLAAAGQVIGQHGALACRGLGSHRLIFEYLFAHTQSVEQRGFIGAGLRRHGGDWKQQDRGPQECGNRPTHVLGSEAEVSRNSLWRGRPAAPWRRQRRPRYDRGKGKEGW